MYIENRSCFLELYLCASCRQVYREEEYGRAHDKRVQCTTSSSASHLGSVENVICNICHLCVTIHNQIIFNKE